MLYYKKNDIFLARAKRIKNIKRQERAATMLVRRRIGLFIYIFFFYTLPRTVAEIINYGRGACARCRRSAEACQWGGPTTIIASTPLRRAAASAVAAMTTGFRYKSNSSPSSTIKYAYYNIIL